MDIKEQVAVKILDYAIEIDELKAELTLADSEIVADQVIPLVRADVLRVATNRIKALGDLLVCYRIGKHPTEKLHTRLDKSGKDWDNLNKLEVSNGR